MGEACSRCGTVRVLKEAEGRVPGVRRRRWQHWVTTQGHARLTTGASFFGLEEQGCVLDPSDPGRRRVRPQGQAVSS